MEASERLEALVAAYRATRETGELELRLGMQRGDRFVSGLDRATFEQLLAELKECPAIVDDERWTEMVDYHYVSRQGQVRSRVYADSSDMTLTTEHVQKEAARTLTCVVQEAPGRDDDGALLACRVSLATETPVTDAPAHCIPSHVRVKQRRSFRDVRDGRTVWRYDLSRAWSAPSRLAVEHAQNDSPPVYEIECEFVDEGGHYLDAHDDRHVARSLWLKARMLIGIPDAVEVAVLDHEAHGAAVRKRKRKA